MKIKKIEKKFVIALLYLSLPIFLISTNPQHLPIVLLTVPYILLFLILYVTAYLAAPKYFKKSLSGSRTKQVIISGLFGVIPVLLIWLVSIRQFNVWDILLTLVILILVSWYLLRADFFK